MDYISSESMWDDVLIASSSQDEHIKHGELIFERFKKFGLLSNQSNVNLGSQK